VLLAQRDDGFRYTSDSLFLVDFIRGFKLTGEVLDVGCGCGIIGLLLAKHHPHLSVSLIDIDPVNCKITEANGHTNGLMVSTICGDFLTLPTEKKYDFIVSNPPYYPSNTTQSSHTHLATSRYESYLPLENFLEHAQKLLKPQGELLICHHPQALSRVLMGIKSLKAIHLQMVHATIEKEASLVMVRYKKDSKSPLKILPPLVAMSDGIVSPQAQKIYETYQTKSTLWTL
jgi:tRNA1(Val) A37 N6-methylase TrmN6